FSFCLPPRPNPPLFPYTTLFRSFLARIDLSQRQLREGEVSRIDSLDFPQMLQRFVEFAELQVVQSQTRLPFRILGPQLYGLEIRDRKSTRLNSSHEWISYAVFCL